MCLQDCCNCQQSIKCTAKSFGISVSFCFVNIASVYFTVKYYVVSLTSKILR